MVIIPNYVCLHMGENSQTAAIYTQLPYPTFVILFIYL